MSSKSSFKVGRSPNNPSQWEIRIHTSHRKAFGGASKQRNVRGYATESAALADIPRLEDFLARRSVKYVGSFERSPEMDANTESDAASRAAEWIAFNKETGPKPLTSTIRARRQYRRERPLDRSGKPMQGAVAKGFRRWCLKHYNAHGRTAGASGKPFEEWMYDNLSMLTDLARARQEDDAPVTRQILYTRMIWSDKDVQHGVMRQSIANLQKRAETVRGQLRVFQESYAGLTTALRNNVYDPHLLRASFAGAEGVQLQGDKMSKAQETRLHLQCLVTKEMFSQLIQRAEAELKHIGATVLAFFALTADSSKKRKREESEGISENESEEKLPEYLWVLSRAGEREALLKTMTMAAMATSARNIWTVDSTEFPSSTTTLKWYNEFKKHGGFKEDMRGIYERDNFLDDFGYKARFLLYLRTTKKFTVKTVLEALQRHIIEEDLPKDPDKLKKVEAMLPLSQSTVWRWMKANGCKYEEATCTYYTDSHEADDTKKDRTFRYILPQITLFSLFFPLMYTTHI
jgi:hypothetical protein